MADEKTCFGCDRTEAQLNTSNDAGVVDVGYSLRKLGGDEYCDEYYLCNICYEDSNEMLREFLATEA